MQSVRATTTAALVLLFGAMVPAYAQQKENEKEAKPEKQAAQPQQAKQKRAQQAKPQQPKQQSAQQTKAQQPKQRSAQQTKAQQPKQQRAQQAKPQQPKQERAQQTKAQQPKQQRAQQTKAQQPKQQARSQQGQQQPQRTRQQAVAWQQQRGWLQQGGGWQGHSTWQQDRSQQWASDHRTWAQRGGYGGYYIPEAQFSLDFGIRHGFRMHGIPSIYMGYPRFAYGGFSFLLVDPYPESWAVNWYDTDNLYIGFDNGYYLYDSRYPGMGLAITVSL